MITKEEKNMETTIMMMEKPITFGSYTLNGQASINEMFFGFNMYFNISHMKDATQQHNLLNINNLELNQNNNNGD